MKVAIILLAAGSSSRLGQSKQLLEIDGVPLLERSAKVALASGASEVVVVLGSNEQEHRNVIGSLPVKIIQNVNWHNGMGSSIKAGLNYLLSSSIVDAVVIMVCDQPMLDANHLQNLMKAFKEKNRLIVASQYGHIRGVPALFSNEIFERLLLLDDHAGAKNIINEEKKIELVNFPTGNVDIDTWEDYEEYRSSQK